MTHRTRFRVIKNPDTRRCPACGEPILYVYDSTHETRVDVEAAPLEDLYIMPTEQMTTGDVPVAMQVPVYRRHYRHCRGRKDRDDAA